MPRIPCEVCGNLFYAKPTRIAAGYGRFCGGACYGAQKQTRVEITCSRDGCSETRMVKPVEIKRGGGKYCSDPCARLDRVRTDRQVAEDAWERVDKTGLHWPFTGATQSAGYGHVKMNGQWKSMTHVAWFLATGHWPVKGEVILHTLDCGSEGCCRNDDVGTFTLKNGTVLPRRGHLALGGIPDNNHDMSEKGRRGRGEMYKSAKLTEADVREIRRLYAEGIPQGTLAKQFGVHQMTISRIVRRIDWAHVI